MEITLGNGEIDGDRVDALYKGHLISTAQDGSHPAPFDLFMASIGTCAAFYVSRFCRNHGIPTEGIRLEQSRRINPETKMVERIEIMVRLPQGFPEKYRDAVVRSANLCSVKKHLELAPQIDVQTEIVEPV
jgi:ribosomal protein S12 methylthiotransferase accessory factor